MKNLILIFICTFILNGAIEAQYRINKTRYDYRTYQYRPGDPYNPSVSGVCSFLLPGLGQMFAGEGGRGAAFLCGTIGLYVIAGIGAGESEADLAAGGDGSKGSGLTAFGILGALAVDIWAIVDAVRVAKVNNLAFRDSYRPPLNIVPKYDPITKSAGLALKFRF